MIIISIGVIIFFLLILAIIYQDDYKRRALQRKSARFNEFWDEAKDRRKTVRINVGIDVLYEILYGNAAQRRRVVSRNISLGGINLGLKEKLSPGTVLKLQLNVPKRTRPLFLWGKIVWVKEISGELAGENEQRLFATGIEFTQIDPRDAVFLETFITPRIKND